MSDGAGGDGARADDGSFHLFKVQGDLLAEGRQDTPLFATGLMWGHLKVYAQGGENDLHAHPLEEHVFIVLQGSATFVDAAERATVLGPYEGIVLPKGTYYRFQSSGDDNLVMLRVGAGSNSRVPGKQDERIGPDAQPMRGNPGQVGKTSITAVPTGAVFGYGAQDRPPERSRTS